MIVDGTPSRAAGRPQWLPALGTACIVGAALLQIVVAAARQLLVTGAVPGDEFYFAGLVYAHLSGLERFAFVLLIGAAVHSVMPDLRRRGAPPLEKLPASTPRRLRLAAAGLIGVALLTGWTTGTVLAVLLYGVSGRARVGIQPVRAAGSAADSLAEVLKRVSLRTLAGWTLPLWMIASISVLWVTLGESIVYSGDFSPRLFPIPELWRYRQHLLPISVQCGLIFALLYVSVPALAALALRVLRVQRDRAARTLVAALQSLLMTALLAAATWRIAGDQLEKNGVIAEVAVVFALCALLWFRAIDDALAVWVDAAAVQQVEAATLWRVAASAPLFLPLSALGEGAGRWLRGRLGRMFGLQAVGAALWMALLYYTAYPELDDFRSYFISIGVFTAVHVSTLGLMALLSAWFAPEAKPAAQRVIPQQANRKIQEISVAQPSATWRRTYLRWGVGALLVLLWLADFLPRRGDVMLIVSEYARFGYVVGKVGLRHRLTPASCLGGTPGQSEPVFFVKDSTYPPALLNHAIGPATRVLPPIVMFLLDAGRPDRMGCYGYARPTTPHIDALARDSVVFERAYSMATATTCGVRHLFTGRYSSRYMLSTAHDPFFLHALRPHGYRTFYLVALGSDFNGVSMDSFRRGGPPAQADGSRFLPLGLPPDGPLEESPDRTKVDSVTQAWTAAFAAGGAAALDGSLTFVHLTGTHFPWFNENPIVDFGDDWSSRYDGEMAKADALTGELLDLLRSNGAYDRAIILLFADHGTGLLEHGRWGGFLPYEEQIRIPLLIKLPGVRPGRVRESVATIDFAPTLLNLFEPGALNPYDGISLLQFMQPEGNRTGSPAEGPRSSEWSTNKVSEVESSGTGAPALETPASELSVTVVPGTGTTATDGSAIEALATETSGPDRSVPGNHRRYTAHLCAFEDAYALIEDGRWKLHFHRAENYSLLFDLKNDPGETRNVYEDHPKVAARLMERMHEFLWEGRRGFANPSFYRDWTPPEE